MLEPRRSQYLRALGVDVYVPRFILPGAAASQPCAWEDAVDAAAGVAIENAGAIDAVSAALLETSAIEASASEILATETTASAPQRSMRVDLDLDNAIPKRRTGQTSAVVEQPSAAAEPKSGADVPAKFALSVVVSDCGILLVDDAPANAGVRNEYLRLLGNILFALRGQPAQSQLDVFLWPAVKHPQLDQSPAAARETLAAHLQKQIQQHAIGTVLLLGDAAQQWCAFEQGAGVALQCIKSVSALACLQQPQYKRQLWRDIRHLAAVR